MLNNIYITKSKTRQDLLTLYFNNTDKKYYLRELERILGYSAGNIRRELQKLCEDNFFLKEKIGNLIFYKLNGNHPLYAEIKSIINKTAGITEKIKTSLFKVTDIETAFIYGSFAQDKTTATSDIDLMIIGAPKTTEIIKATTPLENKYGREINFTIYSREEFDNKKNIRSFLKEVIKNKKIFLIGDLNDL
jgi:predicted nucleotidyltransferase